MYYFTSPDGKQYGYWWRTLNGRIARMDVNDAVSRELCYQELILYSELTPPLLNIRDSITRLNYLQYAGRALETAGEVLLYAELFPVMQDIRTSSPLGFGISMLLVFLAGYLNNAILYKLLPEKNKAFYMQGALIVENSILLNCFGRFMESGDVKFAGALVITQTLAYSGMCAAFYLRDKEMRRLEELTNML